MTGAATVERLLAALRARDGEAVAALLHPEIVATGDKGTYEGVEAVVGWAKPSDDGHLVSRVEVDEIRELAGHAHRHRRPPPVALEGGARRRRRRGAIRVLFEFRDGQIYRWRQNFGSIVEAIDSIPA